MSKSVSSYCAALLLTLALCLGILGGRCRAGNSLSSGQTLLTGARLMNGPNYALSMQGDCNLVLYTGGRAIWSTGTTNKGANCVLRMQSDGNLVVYANNGNGRALWASNTKRSQGNYVLILQADRNLVIYAGSKAIWATNTRALEESYEALKTFQILGVEKSFDNSKTCSVALETLGSSTSKPKDFFDALRVNSILECQIGAQTFEDVTSKLKLVIKDADSLLDFYYSILGLLHIKDKDFNVVLPDADGVFHSIKALSQSDGRWRHDSHNALSSTHAAGLALEALAGVVSLSDSEVDQSKCTVGTAKLVVKDFEELVNNRRIVIGIAKHDIVKLFDSIKGYDDGSLYFDDNHIDGNEYKGPLLTSSSVVRGVTAFAAVTPGKLNIPGDKMLGLAKFFLSIGIPGTTKDLFNQLLSLSCLENNRISVPLILSLPATVLSMTSKDQLKVEVTTVLGSVAPPLSVNLVQASAPMLENKKLQFDKENSVHYLDIAPLKVDVGKYNLAFEISLHDPENANFYATGGIRTTLVLLTGQIKIEKAEIGILDSDAESAAAIQKLDLSKDSTISLAANHLQKMRVTLQLMTPLGHTFKPHQVFFKLIHESKVEHIFIPDTSARQFKITLDFLRLVEKLYYLSGRYEIELTIGDTAMENSFLRRLGYIELDLPEPPEKATRPPPQPVDIYSRFGPKLEISHIFRAPEKRPPKELSVAFLVLTLLPLGGLLIGFMRLGVNLKGFPWSSGPALFAVLFHAGIAAVLFLYVLFWLKLDLFATLKALGLIGVFLVFVGHRTLSHLASTSNKLKTT